MILKKVKLSYTDKGYSYIKCTREDCLNWGGAAICDNCNKHMEGDVYLIFVLGRALCKECFDEWLENAIGYKEDLEYQNETHLKWYKKLGFEVYEEENHDI